MTRPKLVPVDAIIGALEAERDRLTQTAKAATPGRDRDYWNCLVAQVCGDIATVRAVARRYAEEKSAGRARVRVAMTGGGK